MDDIVKRIRQQSYFWLEPYEAADEIEQLHQRVAELEKERDRLSGLCDKWNFECDEMREDNKRLANVADALKQQRDELLAVLGSGGRHCNDDTPHSNLCEAIIDSKEADLGQGLDPFWKWAFRRGFHEAETSYKVDIATLEQQCDELLAALEKIKMHSVSLADAQVVALEAIASAKEKA